MRKKYLTNSAIQTKKLGEKLAKKILKKTTKKKGTFVIGLTGELGGGKTTFLQGLAKGLGIKQKILSPTFVIMKKFKVPKKKNFYWFYHIDCYRLQKPKELFDLGFKEIISNPQNIVAIEWAEKIKKILPKNAPILKFKFIDEKTREIILSSAVL
jgi:tRNA threonylcarbamoyladenosine biosynthesis protein TsaE